MKYFFHLEDGEYIQDPKGTEFPDDASAMSEAMKVAQGLSEQILQQRSEDRVHAHKWRVVVKNADGVLIGSVPVPPATLPEVTTH